jgi:dTDP-4-amino-4,6-dideoxygalactose transaminase
MSVETREKLALYGGPKAVTIRGGDRWAAISDLEIAAVNDLLAKRNVGHLYSALDTFEKSFAEFVGVKYALTHCNGTASLHAACFAAGVGPGHEVIVPSYTWHATITPALHCGATPVFAELDPRNLCLDPRDVERRITLRTKAIVVTHVFGNVADMDGLMDVANRHGLVVIEDCSHAHGATWRGRQVGSIGHIGCFSMQASKALSAVEGGVLTTNDPKLFDRALILGGYGRITDLKASDEFADLKNMGLGLKYRANPLGIAFAGAQLKRLNELNEHRTRCADYLNAQLRGVEGIATVEPLPGARRGGYLELNFRYTGEEKWGVSPETFAKAVAAEGVSIWLRRGGYGAMHLEPLFNDFDLSNLGGCFYDWKRHADGRRPKRYAPGSLPITESVVEQMFSLPAFALPPDGLLDQYVAAVKKVLANVKQLKEE